MTQVESKLKIDQNRDRFTSIDFLAIVYLAHKIIPSVGALIPSFAYLGLFALLFLMLLSTLWSKSILAMLGLFSVSALALCVKIADLPSALLFVYGELQILLYALIAVFFIERKSVKSCQRLFVFIAIMYVITTLTTYISTFTDPQASRVLATLSNDDPLFQEYSRKNIGGFAFIYELILLTPLLIYTTHKKILHPLIAYPLFILLGITIVATEYGTAVLFFFATLILLFIPHLTTKKLVLILVVLLLIVLLFGGLLADGFQKISQTMNSDVLSERFLTIAETLRGEDQLSEGTGTNRIELYNTAWTAFTSSTFLGVWGKQSTGGHSFVLDTLGNYGVLGALALLLLFATIYRVCLRPYRHQPFYPYFFWTVLCATALMVLNPHSCTILFVCFLPLCGKIFSAINENKEVT